MMSSPPVTIPSLFVWKIKHWASRLYSCKFPPPEGEADEAMSEEGSIGEEDKIMQRSGEIGGGEAYYREEDYIVFCFTKDGEIRLMEDTKPDTSTPLWPHKGEEKWRKDSIAQSDESSDSNQSQASTAASFAFPVLRRDWVGSPIKMPNPDGRKHKFRAWILRLCTFPTPWKQNSL